MTAARDLQRGARIADHRIEAVLGRGGMSVVYLAEDLRLKRRVALKILAPALAEDERFRQRFLHESELAASLDHANVIPIYEAGEADGSLFIAMRYVDGSDLKALLRDGPLPAERAVALIAQVAGALDAAHEHGLVHGDVKPSNVLIDERDHAYLADFGLTHRMRRAVSDRRAQLVGTIDYVAPEQIRGEEVDGRADVYSLGCLLHECLTGRPPFRRATDAATLYAHLEEEPPSTGTAADQVMEKALAKTPEERYDTCRELVEGARKALGISPPHHTRLRAAVVSAAIAIAAVSVLAFSVLQSGGPGAPRGRLLRVDPASNRVTGSVAVGPAPTGVAAGTGNVWVSTESDSSVWRIDMGSLDASRIAAHGSPIGIAANGKTAYVAIKGASGYGAGYVTRIDARYGQTTDQVQTGGIWAVASGPAGVWVTRDGGATPIGNRVDVHRRAHRAGRDLGSNLLGAAGACRRDRGRVGARRRARAAPVADRPRDPTGHRVDPAAVRSGERGGGTRRRVGHGAAR